MHPLRNRKLPRRTVLRGIIGGSLVSVALPPLEAMLNSHGEAFADGSEGPCRFMTWMWGAGMMRDRFEPTDVGDTWALSEELMPLAPVKDYINLCTGRANNSDFFITHHEGMVVFSGHDIVPGGGGAAFASDHGGPTVDQVIAEAIFEKEQTPLRSIEVRVTKENSDMDDGGTSAFNLSVRQDGGVLTPLVSEANPQKVWQRLFGDIPVPGATDDRQPRLSVLDAVRADADKLRGRLGSKDSERLDAHLEGISELQNKLTSVAPACEVPDEPTETNSAPNGQEDVTEVCDVMANLLALAFVCDQTRVASCMFSGLATGVEFGEAGIGSSHHANSHLLGGGAIDRYHNGIVYTMERLSQFLEVFQRTEELPGQNLLDSMILYASSEVSVGWNHSINRQPIILAGHGRGYLKFPGTHSQGAPNDPGQPNQGNAPTGGSVSDVLLTCLQAFDPAATSIGSDPTGSSTPLADIRA